MKIVFTLFILIAIGCNSQSNNSSIDKTAQPLIDTFFKNIKANNTESALVKLLGSNSNISIDDSATLNLKNSFTLLNNYAGAYMGNRLLKKRNLEDDICVYSYLAKYEKKFYRFIFMFYNNGVSIKLYKFMFDDNLDVELEESLKYYLN